MRKPQTLSFLLLILCLVALIMVGPASRFDDAKAFTGTVEYKDLSTTGATSTNGNTFQGDVLFCCWGTFTGTVKVQLYHTLGPTGSKGVWIDTGDILTAEGCKILQVPENGVKLRAYATLSSGSVKVRLSQEYPSKVISTGK